MLLLSLFLLHLGTAGCQLCIENSLARRRFIFTFVLVCRTGGDRNTVGFQLFQCLDCKGCLSMRGIEITVSGQISLLAEQNFHNTYLLFLVPETPMSQKYLLQCEMFNEIMIALQKYGYT